MGINNLITLVVGFLLMSTGFITKKSTGIYDWLYILLGLVIFCIGLLQLCGVIKQF